MFILHSKSLFVSFCLERSEKGILVLEISNNWESRMLPGCFLMIIIQGWHMNNLLSVNCWNEVRDGFLVILIGSYVFPWQYLILVFMIGKWRWMCELNFLNGSPWGYLWFIFNGIPVTKRLLFILLKLWFCRGRGVYAQSHNRDWPFLVMNGGYHWIWCC